MPRVIRVGKRIMDAVTHEGVGVLKGVKSLSGLRIGDAIIMLYRSRGRQDQELTVRVVGIISIGAWTPDRRANVSVIDSKFYGQNIY